MKKNLFLKIQRGFLQEGNACKSEIFSMTHMDIIDGDDDDHNMYDNELYSEGAFTARTPPVKQDPLSGRSTQESGMKIFPPGQMLQRLLILLAKYKSDKQNLTNFPFIVSDKINFTKVYNNLFKSVQE